jgi:hypothetical protein
METLLLAALIRTITYLRVFNINWLLGAFGDVANMPKSFLSG